MPAGLRVSQWVPQAGVLHAISPISVKRGQLKGLLYPRTQKDKLVHSLERLGRR